MKVNENVTALVAALVAFGALSLASPGELPKCEFEDGNPNGKKCLWVDPDTGKSFVSLSENYIESVDE
jgi:hypothetical protein